MNLRQSLKNSILENRISGLMLPYAPALVLAYPIVGLVYYYSNLSSDFLAFVLAILYFAYIAGLIFCYADEKDMFIGIALILRALPSFKSLFAGYGFALSTLVYLIVYAGLGGYILYRFFNASGKKPFREDIYRGPVSYESVPQQPVQMNICPKCGTPREEGFFCPGCGFDYRQVAGQTSSRPEQRVHVTPTRTAAPYSGPAGRIALLGSSTLTLVFAALVTAGILLNYVAGFSFIGFVISIPSLLICIGLWLIYVGSAKGTLTTTGFSLINGVLTFEMIASTIGFVLLGLVGLFIMAVGGGNGDAVKVAIMIIVLAIVLAFPVVYYFSQLKKTTKAARRLARGENVSFNASMYVIVILCINAISQVFSALRVLFGNSLANTTIQYFVDACEDSLNMAGLGDVTPYITDITDSLFKHSALESIASIVSAATVIVAIMILLQIRKERNNTSF